MKIFNIQNPNKFFERLSHCSGRVELVDPAGKRIRFSEDDEVIRAVRFLSGPIDELQIDFEKSADCMDMLHYAAQMNIVA